jgi:hypothetical protein
MGEGRGCLRTGGVAVAASVKLHEAKQWWHAAV